MQRGGIDASKDCFLIHYEGIKRDTHDDEKCRQVQIREKGGIGGQVKRERASRGKRQTVRLKQSASCQLGRGGQQTRRKVSEGVECPAT